MAESLRNIISQINTSAGHVVASSEELTASVEQASVATEQITKRDGRNLEQCRGSK